MSEPDNAAEPRKVGLSIAKLAAAAVASSRASPRPAT